jgi:phospholipid/cholesterol/gamma-HCH transport system substrate-binding protein
MTQQLAARRTALGAIAAGVIALLIVIIGMGGGQTYTLHAVFANVNGLVTTGHVEVAGFKVGEITGISVRVGGYPEVTMQVSDSYRVREGAHAVIELGSLAGQLNRYVALTGGTGPKLPDGATIPLKHTSQPVEIDQFLSVLNPKTRTELRNLLRDAVYTLRGRGPDIEQALRYSTQAFGQAANLFTDVSADGSALRTLVARASQGAQAVASGPADLKDTIAKLSQLLTVTATRQTQVTQSLQRFPAAFAATRSALQTLDSSIPVFSRLLDAANPALDAIDPFARTLRVAAPVAAPVFEAALRLVNAFRIDSPAIKRLLGAPLPNTLHNLGVGLHGINPVFDQLRARTPDVLGWIPLLGDVTANYNINGHGGLVLAYPRPAPQRPVSSPSCAAGWLLRPFDRAPGQLACEPWTNYANSFVGGGKPDSAYLTAAQQAPWPGEFP